MKCSPHCTIVLQDLNQKPAENNPANLLLFKEGYYPKKLLLYSQ